MKETLVINDDLDLELIADSGQCFRWEKREEDTYRVIHLSDCLYIKSLGGEKYELEYDPENCRTNWQDYLDLDEDYGSIRGMIDKGRDPFLYEASEYQKGIRILRQDPWEMLVTFIISQNKNIPGIRKCVEKLCRTAGEKRTDIRGEEYWGFPHAKAIDALCEDDLRSCSLGYRCAYISAAAKAVIDGHVDLASLIHADDDETMDKLTSIHGVGVKVASCVSLFGLHHLDSFPVDVWMKRILEEKYPKGYPYEDYSPYNGIYQQYMFAYYRSINH